MPDKPKFTIQGQRLTFQFRQNNSISIELSLAGLLISKRGEEKVHMVRPKDGGLLLSDDIQQAFDAIGVEWDKAEFDLMMEMLHKTMKETCRESRYYPFEDWQVTEAEGLPRETCTVSDTI